MATELLVAGDIEASLISLLGAGMPSVPWSGRVPKDRPPEFGRLARIGGTRRQIVLDQPMVGAWLWAGSDVRATELALEAEGRIFAAEGTILPGGIQLYEVRGISGVRITEDVDSKTPMAVFTVQLTWRLTRR